MTAADRSAAVDRLAEAKVGDGILVIGTTPFIGEGFDAPVLDTQFLAGPISHPDCKVGRVMRGSVVGSRRGWAGSGFGRR